MHLQILGLVVQPLPPTPFYECETVSLIRFHHTEQLFRALSWLRMNTALRFLLAVNNSKLLSIGNGIPIEMEVCPKIWNNVNIWQIM